MTDRLKGVAVTFDRDIREDDAEAIIGAIRMLRGVADVTPSVANLDDTINRSRIRYELHQKLYRALDPEGQ